jgi:hypothetical protein
MTASFVAITAASPGREWATTRLTMWDARRKAR